MRPRLGAAMTVTAAVKYHEMILWYQDGFCVANASAASHVLLTTLLANERASSSEWGCSIRPGSQGGSLGQCFVYSCLCIGLTDSVLSSVLLLLQQRCACAISKWCLDAHVATPPAPPRVPSCASCPDNMLEMLGSPAQPSAVRLASAAFAVIIIGQGIPVYCVLMR